MHEKQLRTLKQTYSAEPGQPTPIPNQQRRLPTADDSDRYQQPAAFSAESWPQSRGRSQQKHLVGRQSQTAAGQLPSRLFGD